jgi:hypothetical protein
VDALGESLSIGRRWDPTLVPASQGKHQPDLNHLVRHSRFPIEGGVPKDDGLTLQAGEVQDENRADCN